MSTIKLYDINKFYGNGKNKIHILKDINLSIEQGELIAISGESGSGKTTLLNILGGLLNFESGEYYFDGKAMRTVNQRKLAEFRRKNIGFIVQDFALIHSRTVRENIELPLKSLKISSGRKKEMIDEILTKLNIQDKINSYPHELSGGEQQRVAIARALINKPNVILADEPTGSLDKVNQESIIELLAEISKSGITVVVVSHNDDVVKRCERIIKIKAGVVT